MKIKKLNANWFHYSYLFAKLWVMRSNKEIMIICTIYTKIKVKQQAIALMSGMFASGQGYLVSIPGQVIPKTQKMVLHSALLSTQHYKVRIKSNAEQSQEWSSTLPYTTVY